MKPSIDVSRDSRPLELVVFLGLLAVFIVDLLTPRGSSIWVAYLLLILLSMRRISKRKLLIIGLLASFFTILGIIASPPGASMVVSLTSRSLGIVLIWAGIWTASEWERAEEASRESEDRSRDLIEYSHDLICTHDLEGRLLSVNPAPAKILGYTPDELLGTPMRDLLEPEVRGQFETYLETVRREGCAAGLLSVRTKSGETRVWEYNNTLRTEGVPQPIVRGLAHDVTDRIRVEKALRKSNENFSLISETIAEVFWIAGAGLNQVEYVSPAYERIWGRPRELLYESPKSFMDSVFPQDRELVMNALQAQARGEPFECEYRILLPDGQVRWILDRGFPVHEKSGGGIVRYVGVARDITRQKEEESFRISLEERFSKAFNANPEPITISTLLSGTYIDANEAFLRITGFKREEIIGHNIRDTTFWHVPEARARLLEELAKGPVRDFEFEFVAKSGEVRSGLLSADVIQVDGERCLLAITKDVTGHKRAGESIRKLSRAVEQSPVAVMVTDRLGNIEYVNPKFTELTGHSLDEVRGKTPRILKSGETQQEDYKKLWETISSGGEWRGEFHNRKKDGTHYWGRASISPIRDETGTITHFVGVQEDFTSHKLLEDQLRQAQKMEAVGRLAGGVAHDFNNLLTIIGGYSELLLSRANENDTQRTYLGEIKKASDRAADLTRQLLAFSRQQVLAPRKLDLNMVIGNLEKMLRRLIGEDIELVTNLKEGLSQVKADPGQVEQVIMNLAVNARDAMPQGGRLTLETANVDLDEDYVRTHVVISRGHYVMLAVSDTGIGMDEQTQSRIFEPFFTTKEKGKGTGLGLAMVYGIVKQSGGNIWVYSEKAKGSTFKIYLPRVDVSEAEVSASEVSGSAPGGSEVILLVEDEAALRSLAVKVLRERGYDVLESTSVEDAMHIGENHKEPIDLLVTDVVMPGMSGRNVAGHLRLLRPNMKVLFMSGYTDDVVVRSGLLDAGTAFLQKPFTPEGLARKIRGILDLPPAPPESEESP